MLIELSLQERGEVITHRRVRLTEADANRVYNALEALLDSIANGAGLTCKAEAESREHTETPSQE